MQCIVTYQIVSCCFITLYALAIAVQCIVIGPVCLFMCLFVCLWLCGSVTTITRNYVHRSSPNWVCRWRYIVTISSWLNFDCPAPPGRGSAARRKILAPPYYSKRAVFVTLHLSERFFHCQGIFIFSLSRCSGVKVFQAVPYIQFYWRRTIFSLFFLQQL